MSDILTVIDTVSATVDAQGLIASAVLGSTRLHAALVTSCGHGSLPDGQRHHLGLTLLPVTYAVSAAFLTVSDAVSASRCSLWPPAVMAAL